MTTVNTLRDASRVVPIHESRLPLASGSGHGNDKCYWQRSQGESLTYWGLEDRCWVLLLAGSCLPECLIPGEEALQKDNHGRDRTKAGSFLSVTK